MDLLRELKAMPVTLHLLQVSSSGPGLKWFQRQQFQEHLAGLLILFPQGLAGINNCSKERISDSLW